MAKITRRQKLQAKQAHQFGLNGVPERKFFDNKRIFARNTSQENALDSLRENTLTILSGPPGTAKTLMSVYVAVELLENREIEKIYYVKPIVDVVGEQGLGFLPGEVNDKVAPHIAPVKDALTVFMSPSKAEYLLEKKIIEFIPIEYLRGRSLNNCFIIADEMQNALPSSVLTILTRLGSNSKVSLMGDIVQRDIAAKFGFDGLSDALNRLSSLNDVGYVEFGQDDICRSSFVKSVIGRYSDLYEHRRIETFPRIAA